MTAKNASGDTFKIRHSIHGWDALQMTGCNRNYLGIPACITADTKVELMRKLRAHESN